MGYATWVLAASNFSLWLSGIGLLAAAAHMTSTYGASFYFSNTIFPHSLLIGLAIILLIVGVLGWYGALADSDWMLMLFAITMSVIFVMELVGACSLYAHKKLMIEGGKLSLEACMRDFDEDSRFIFMQIFQQDHKCCGRTGPNDYFSRKQGIPESCCKKEKGKKSQECSFGKAYQNGCEKNLLRILDEGMTTIAPLVTGFASCHLVLMVVTFVCTYITSVERRKLRYTHQKRNIFKRMLRR